MKNFRTYNLALDLYRATHGLKFPNSEIKNQFQRASLSIVLNLAEGSGKRTTKDRKRFYSIAMGSLRETQALLEILNQTKLINQASQVGANLYRLIQNSGGE